MLIASICWTHAFSGSSRPIGFWLKLLDRLIDVELGAALHDAGLTRRQWQLLNVLADGPSDLPALERSVRPFLSEHEPDLAPAVDGLVAHGWLNAGAGTVSLTDGGRRGRDEVAAVVGGVRARMSNDVTGDDYATTVTTLATMARNLGWDGDDATA